MKTVVLGSGGWGTALSQILCDNGHETYLWSHSPAKAAEMARTRENPLLQGVHLPESLHITGDLGCLRAPTWWSAHRPPSPCGRQPKKWPRISRRRLWWCPFPRGLSGTQICVSAK